MALHSSFNENLYKKACGMALLPLRTKANGPAPLTKERDIIDQAFDFFRVNVLFKNFDLQGPADPVLVYLKLEQGAKKRLTELMAEKVPRPREKGYFMSTMLEEVPNQLDTHTNYIKQLKEETVLRFLEKFYVEGQQSEDYRLWCGLSRRKFMGYNFTAGF